MQQPGQVNINETIEAWADIVIKMWKAKITELKIYDTGDLFNSLLHDLLRNSGEDINKIDFSFLLYGIYVDMGVGKELSSDKRVNDGRSGAYSKNLGYHDVGRNAKEWFSKIFYREVMKLRDILGQAYADSVRINLINSMGSSFDQRYADINIAPSVSNLRTVRYREKHNAAVRRNYYKKRGVSDLDLL